jgi:hypothetical protein
MKRFAVLCLLLIVGFVPALQAQAPDESTQARP